MESPDTATLKDGYAIFQNSQYVQFISEQMQVPERIIAIGTGQYIGTRSAPPEIVFDNSVLPINPYFTARVKDNEFDSHSVNKVDKKRLVFSSNEATSFLRLDGKSLPPKEPCFTSSINKNKSTRIGIEKV